MNNDMKLVCNCIHHYKFDCEHSVVLLLSWFYDIQEAKLCRESLIFIFNNHYYEVVESDPEMTPEQLFNYWRLMYE